MWETFWPDVLVAVISAALTVTIAYIAFRLEQGRNERQLLNNLVRDLHHRRALKKIDPYELRDAEQNNDYKWTNKSILDLRDQIRVTREKLPPSSKAHDSLSKMYVACSRHLHEGPLNPDHYQFHLMELRPKLEREVRDICQRVKGVDLLLPGEAR